MAVTGKKTETLAMELLTCSHLGPLAVALIRAVAPLPPFPLRIRVTQEAALRKEAPRSPLRQMQ